MPEIQETRSLHLLGATGQVRTEMIGGKEHLVVPVVALMEGVIHAVNAKTPEFVPTETLKKAAASWNGRPVTLGHPKKDGEQVSALAPSILESHGIGTIRNARVEGKKMLCEALLDKARTKILHPSMYASLAEGGTEEVSVGALVITDKMPGEYNKKKYNASWTFAQGDHLAFLPGGRGACSVAMGCGTHRAAMRVCLSADSGFLPTGAKLATEDHLEDVVEATPRMPSCLTFTTLEDLALNQRIQAVQDAVREEWNDPPEPPDPYAYTAQVFDDFAIVCKGEETFKVPYSVDKEGEVTLGKPVAVKQAWVAASDAGEIKLLAGARHSAKDTSLIQAMHDHTMALGATCDRGNYKLMSAKTEEKPPKIEADLSTIDDPIRRYIATVQRERAN